MPEHDSCTPPSRPSGPDGPVTDPADARPAESSPARRALVGGAVGLGLLGLAATSRAASPPGAGAALVAQPVPAPTPVPSGVPGGPAPAGEPTGAGRRAARGGGPSTTSASTSRPRPRPRRSAAPAAPAAPEAAPVGSPDPEADAAAVAPAPRAPAPAAVRRLTVPDAPPAQAASRAAVRVAAARSAGEGVASAATARARASGIRAAAAATSAPRVTSVTTAGAVIPLAHDSTALRVPVTSGVGTGYAAVARSTTPTNPGIFTTDPVLHLARRATFGPRPSDLLDMRTLGIDAWLSRQLSPQTIPDTAADQVWALWPLAGAGPAAIQAAVTLHGWDAEWQTAMATLGRQIVSQRQLYEQVVDVMANHLHVALPCEAWDTAPSYVSDVIRPLAMGRYRDLLLAAMRHPAMLQYLNNDVSSKTLVNENLGRELLELHTVGFGAGYTEAEVVNSAKVLTGRMVSSGRFVYRPEYHWTGPLSVMGWSSANATAADGLAVGDDYLTYLAGHPSTARTIARKLAVRFVSDQPPAALVDRMAAAYLANDTDVRAVLDCLFRSPEFWASTGQRSRRPLEDVVGAARVLDMRPGPNTRSTVETLFWVVRNNGQGPLGWAPPNGYPDVAAAWNNAGSLLNRFTMHRALVNNWWPGMTVTPALDLVPLRPGLTAGQWVDELSLRLLGQTMTTARRDAVVAVANGIRPTDPAVKASWSAWTLIPLLLDSPYFQLR